MPCIRSTTTIDSTVTQSLFGLFTLPFRLLTTTFFSQAKSLSTIKSCLLSEVSTFSNLPSSISFHSPLYQRLIDIYIASGKNDEHWLNDVALPMLEKNRIRVNRRQTCQDSDQLVSAYDINIRQQSRVLYYLINDHERLSYLAAELAFLIGERKHTIIVYLQPTIDQNAKHIASSCERRDIERSRKYLEDLARKEQIKLSYSREQSWLDVLAIIHNEHEYLRKE
jgi:hypothetical protein